MFGQLVKLLTPEKPFFGTVILTTAAGSAHQKLYSFSSPRQISHLQPDSVYWRSHKLASLCFQISSTGSVALPVGRGWDVLSIGLRFHFPAPTGQPCMPPQLQAAASSLLEIKTPANLILSILLQPCQL